MKLTLPRPVEDYFAADRRGAPAVVACFTDRAVVTDESRVWVGHDAIRQWKESTTSRYRYTSKPIASEEKDGTITVVSRLTGDFPGSPADLRYVFVLDGDKISSLEIKP
ncbi:MAG: nuclear transport factor 2 family protein [Gemmatimonadaceae bacterium]